jgi:hypothetical protein
MGLAKTFEQTPILKKKMDINLSRNKEQDHTALLDRASSQFVYEDCHTEYWNPPEFSLLYGTPLWHQASPTQRLALNHLFWVAYYSQIISAEIATIYYNQTCAAGLYALPDFRIVCDTLDLETSQERAHINAFLTVSDQVEKKLLGENVFSYPMRPYYHNTMIYSDTNWFKTSWRKFQLKYFGLLSSTNSFLACQYFTVRGLRTLNGKMVQHKLAQQYLEHPDKERAPIPSKINYYHFMDESYHFNSSNFIGSEIINLLDPPTRYEATIANLGIRGSLKDHSTFNVCVNGIFWYEPALFESILKILKGPVFGMKEREAINMLELCFCRENEGVHLAYQTHQVAKESYRSYLAKLDYVWGQNKELKAMGNLDVNRYLTDNRKHLNRLRSSYAH